MTVAQLIALLREFPAELPVFFCPSATSRTAIAPVDAVMNLVHPERRAVMGDDDRSSTVPAGFVDALVVYPYAVRADDASE